MYTSNYRDFAETRKYNTNNVKLNESRTGEVADLLKAKKLEFHEREHDYAVKYCPFCNKPHHNNPTNLYKLNIQKDSGCFFCFRCGSKGSWYDLKNFFTNGQRPDSNDGGGENVGIASLHDMSGRGGLEGAAISAGADSIKLAADKHAALVKNTFPEAVKYLTGKDYTKGERGLDIQTLIHYKIGVGLEKFRNDKNEYTDFESVYFPMYSMRKESKKPGVEKPVVLPEDEKASRELMETKECALDKWKIRAVGKENKHRQRVDPPGRRWY